MRAASVTSPVMVPMEHACEALHWLWELEAHQEDGWMLVTDKGPLNVTTMAITSNQRR